MLTSTLRRLYIYIAAFIGLQMLAAGIIELIVFLGERWLGGVALGASSVSAMWLSTSVALVAVGVPLWGAHWAIAQRDARVPEERSATVRRLYTYAALLVALWFVLFALDAGLGAVLGGVRGGRAVIDAVRPFAAVAVNAMVWGFHWRVLRGDGGLSEGGGANATLRRWYLFIGQWVSLALACFGAGILIHGLLQRFIFDATLAPPQLSIPTAALISGVAIWLPLEIWSRRLIREPGPLQAGELGSVLRQVYTALVSTSALIAALTGLTALIAASIRSGLEGLPWAGTLSPETRAMAAVLVAVPVGLYHRNQIMTAAAIGGEERTATARRLVSYLTGAVSLVALYFGLGSTLGILLRLALAPDVIGVGWRIGLSWYAALAIVALPVYALLAWSTERQARSSAEEERAISRRIYLYAALLFGIVASVVTTTLLLRLIIAGVLSGFAPGDVAEIGRLAGYTVIGVALAAAHGALLRRASLARGAAGSGETIVLVGDPDLRATLAAAFGHELPGAKLAAFAVEDEAELRAALGAADLLVVPLAALGNGRLSAAAAAFAGPRLLLATPVDGFTLVGMRRGVDGVAREAARVARGLWRDQQHTPRPPAPARPVPQARGVV